MRGAQMVIQRISSDIFPIRDVLIGDTTEQVVQGGRKLFPLVPRGFGPDVKQVGVIGFKSQGAAQAPDLRDSLNSIGSGIRVKVGLRPDSASIPEAKAAGFLAENDTLGGVLETIHGSDLVLYLIRDSDIVTEYPGFFQAMKRGAVAGFSHGFLQGYFDAMDIDGYQPFPDLRNVHVCPKAMGDSCRKAYLQGSGQNNSVAFSRYDQRLVNLGLAWSVGIGAPSSFLTTARSEYRSDLVGERSDLLAGPWGASEALFDFWVNAGRTPEFAFRESAEQITGVLAPIISRDGVIGVYNALRDGVEKEVFARSFEKAYPLYRALIEEIYTEVESGREILEVVRDGPRIKEFGWTPIETTEMWVVGRSVRENRLANQPINPIVAGIICAMIMAQVDVLRRHGHPWSEICNESCIELVDSLLPYMHVWGVAVMADKCSTTARLGTRKYGPKFKEWTRVALVPSAEPVDSEWFRKFFLDHIFHRALATCMSLRPPMNISVE